MGTGAEHDGGDWDQFNGPVTGLDPHRQADAWDPRQAAIAEVETLCFNSVVAIQASQLPSLVPAPPDKALPRLSHKLMHRARLFNVSVSADGPSVWPWGWFVDDENPNLVRVVPDEAVDPIQDVLGSFRYDQWLKVQRADAYRRQNEALQHKGGGAGSRAERKMINKLLHCIDSELLIWNAVWDQWATLSGLAEPG